MVSRILPGLTLEPLSQPAIDLGGVVDRLSSLPDTFLRRPGCIPSSPAAAARSRLGV